MSKNGLLTIVVGMGRNRCIGVENDLPWHIPADLKRFKALTTGKPVVMGRKTYDSIFARLGKPLPGRPHFVITATASSVAAHPDVTVCRSLEEAIVAARTAYPESDVMIVGGASVYEQAIGIADRLEITEVSLAPEGDAFFPDFDRAAWRIIAETDLPADDKTPSCRFVTFDRV